jgi:adenylylsulfate kinase
MSGIVVWFTGKPASGKSTLAAKVQAEALRRGWHCCSLDGDAVRAALVPTPGYDPSSRVDFYATLANLAALLAKQGLVVLVAATAHRAVYRERARAAAPAFIEVWVNASDSTLGQRDPKGLYAALREGKLSQLPGGDLAYEPPTRAEVVADGGHDGAAVERIVERVVSAASLR